MGTVYKRGDSSVWWIGFLNDAGKWEYRSTGVKDERVARRALEQIEAAIAKGSAIAGRSLTGAQWFEAWKKSRSNVNAAPDVANVERHVLPAFGSRRLVDVKPDDVRALVLAWRADKYAPRTIHNLWWLLRSFFLDAVEAKHLDASPCALKKGDLPKKRDADPRWRRGAVFTRGEAQQLIDGPDAQRRTLWALAFFGGLRLGEISALRWRDYDTEREGLGCIHVAASYTRVNKREKGTKSDVPREVPVHPELAAMLREWRRLGWVGLFGRKPEPGDLVLPNQAGRHFTDNNANGVRDLDFARLQLRRRRFHDTRRTFFTLAQADGAPREVVYAITHNPGDVSDMGEQYTSYPWETLCAAVRGLRLSRRPLRLTTPLTPVDSEGDSTMRDDNETTSAQEGIRTLLGTRSADGNDRLPSGKARLEADESASPDAERRNVGRIPDLPARLRRLVAAYGGGR